MAEPLKKMFSVGFFEQLCPVLQNTIVNFDCDNFIIQVFNNDWPEMELKARVQHIATVLHNFLPEDFPAAASLLVDLSSALKQKEKEQGFAMIFIPDYIRLYGLNHPDESLAAIEQVTQLVSAEFAIRPFLINHTKKTMAQMLKWSKHQHHSVRRLASEGCRPRLPWALGVPHLKKDPTQVIQILENLKTDTSEYVRKSVANNLNDIAKDHPELVIQIVVGWKGLSKETDWIIRHGCRTLLKKGNNSALLLQGFNPKSKSSVTKLNLLDDKIRIGDNLRFDFEFTNLERTAAFFRIEYAIDYLTSSGKISKKTFKVTENNFVANQKFKLSRTQSFKNFTTRKHFKGKHILTIVANGKPLAKKEFVII